MAIVVYQGNNMDFSKLSDWLKLSPKYLFPVSVVTGFLLFASTSTLEVFGLTIFVAQYRAYIGITFLISTALLFTNWAVTVYQGVQKKWKEQASLKNLRKRLHNLSNPEKRILKNYIENKTKTQYLDIGDGVTGGLEAGGVIFRSSYVGNLESWAYNIQPWAWEYLNDHPELLIISDESELEAEHLYRRRR
jgi:hypothetical protein